MKDTWKSIDKLPCFFNRGLSFPFLTFSTTLVPTFSLSFSLSFFACHSLASFFSLALSIPFFLLSLLFSFFLSHSTDLASFFLNFFSLGSLSKLRGLNSAPPPLNRTRFNRNWHNQASQGLDHCWTHKIQIRMRFRTCNFLSHSGRRSWCQCERPMVSNKKYQSTKNNVNLTFY